MSMADAQAVLHSALSGTQCLDTSRAAPKDPWGSGSVLQLPLAEVVDYRLEGSVNSLRSRLHSATKRDILTAPACTAHTLFHCCAA